MSRYVSSFGMVIFFFLAFCFDQGKGCWHVAPEIYHHMYNIYIWYIYTLDTQHSHNLYRQYVFSYSSFLVYISYFQVFLLFPLDLHFTQPFSIKFSFFFSGAKFKNWIHQTSPVDRLDVFGMFGEGSIEKWWNNDIQSEMLGKKIFQVTKWRKLGSPSWSFKCFSSIFTQVIIYLFFGLSLYLYFH